ncbi:hypothetical protein BANRA_01702 [Escherichia coli]|nr:hypothetical protein BANRA_01702 [Escherichia coli]
MNFYSTADWPWWQFFTGAKALTLSYQLLVLICHIIKLYLVMLAMEDAIR